MDDYGERLYEQELKWRNDPNRWTGGTDEDYDRRHGCREDLCWIAEVMADTDQKNKSSKKGKEEKVEKEV